MRAVFDLESTGVDPQHDRVISIAILTEGERYVSLVNPGGRPIPAEVTAITGLTDADVADAPLFKDIAPKVHALLSGKTLVTFGGLRFDLPLLHEEFARCGIEWAFGPMVDVGNLFKILEPRTLAEAVKVYLGRTHDGAHEAMADAEATRDVLFAQLEKYTALQGMSDAGLALFSNHGKRVADPAGKLAYDDAGELVFNTFRNKGVRVADDLGYAQWMTRSNFPAGTRKLLQAVLYPPQAPMTDEEGFDSIFDPQNLEDFR